ncbi:hypothetical protein K2Z83_20385 [Oscillochloris sp. ZM17-4]|uniref:hypothetical protein n=1 Tax=Oscillochloris sp. ZM17-4 TaxID=2866714 RepID=UPI001C731367|nr:hypothetical protein [Oscillochloris sp. ZM17-4]MBX0330030.1 hypothetical protein [Oscillochloris sp. ZM17-4]
MPTLTLTVCGAPVSFAGVTTYDTIDRFAEWMLLINPQNWRVDAAGEDGQLALRAIRDRAVGDPDDRWRWTVQIITASGQPINMPAQPCAADALRQFCGYLPRDGALWRPAEPPRAVVTLIFPDPERIVDEPRPEEVADGVRWLWGMLTDASKREAELSATRQALATALHHLNRNEYLDAREALAALSLEPGHFDYAVFPPEVRAALEAVAASVVSDQEPTLRAHVHNLLDLIGLGWSEAALRDAAQPA